jgi:hypothetical protein
MQNPYQAVKLVLGCSLIALGVYSLKDTTSLKHNPYRNKTSVLQIERMGKNCKTIDNEYRIEAEKSSSLRNIEREYKAYNSDVSAKLRKLNEPTHDRLELLADISDKFYLELSEMQHTNLDWKFYQKWREDTIRQNKDNLRYGFLSLIVGGLAVYSAIKKKN